MRGAHGKIHAKIKWKFYFLDLKEVFSGLEKINLTDCFDIDPPPIFVSMGTKLKIGFSGWAKMRPLSMGGGFYHFLTLTLKSKLPI